VTRIVPLNNVDHGDLMVASGYGAAFGDAVNQVRVFPPEYEALQREYPILFRKDGQGQFYAVALTGLDRDENLFLHQDAWQARTVPAMQRRGPFSIGLQEGAEPQVNVDLAHPRIVAGGGAAVFLRHGGNAPALEDAAAALATIYDGLSAEPALFAALERAGLIEPVTIQVTVGEGRTYTIEDVFTVGAEPLARLEGATLAALHGAGWLAAALWVRSSLANIEALVARKNAVR
jgi:hypothetical protein